jgi:hypothetical protein
VHPEGSLPCSHIPIWSLSWARLIQSISPNRISLRSFLTSLHLRLDVPRDFFPSGFPTKTLYTLLFYHMRATCHAHRILLNLIWLFELHLVTSTSYESPHYACFSNLLPFHPSSVQILSSAPCSQIPFQRKERAASGKQDITATIVFHVLLLPLLTPFPSTTPSLLDFSSFFSYFSFTVLPGMSLTTLFASIGTDESDSEREA